ncbi:translocation protein Sec62, putative [Babesia caballi]|uniref:Translocation protein SEC62 n=1 Tax=Babesia caballi TaxID=5871 RepID=A0AAV4LMI5_BABCB|nr:translocation protein Sec62, putative [Babesia caballi]
MADKVRPTGREFQAAIMQNAEATRKEAVALMEALLNGGIKVKSAAEVGKRAVEYTRGDEIIKWVQDNKATVAKLCPTVMKEMGISPDSDDLINVPSVLVDEGLIYRAQYHPLEGTLEKTATGSFRRPIWPKRLIKTQKQRFDSVGFFIISYEGNQRWNYLMLTAVLLGIFAICMFQAWPLALKLGIWYISVVLLSIMVTLVVLRLVMFVFCWFCGYDFWLFPNLFDEELGVVDSFKPVHSFKYRNDTMYMLCCRLLCSVLVAASIYELRKTHDLRDVGEFARQSFMDIIEWGHNKLTAGKSADPPTAQTRSEPEEPSLYKSIGVDLSADFEAETPSAEAGEDGLDDDGRRAP